MLNDIRWGLGDFTLEETILDENEQRFIPSFFPGNYYKPLSAVRQQFEPGILFQDYYFLKKETRPWGKQEELARRLVRHRFWKIIVFCLPVFRLLRRVYRFFKRLFGKD
ncbi:MAG: hypothetical protein LBQ88_19020 [Treponema sp.]|nr:hypothetical protein [Treponema sp.]